MTCVIDPVVAEVVGPVSFFSKCFVKTRISHDRECPQFQSDCDKSLSTQYSTFKAQLKLFKSSINRKKREQCISAAAANMYNWSKQAIHDARRLSSKRV